METKHKAEYVQSVRRRLQFQSCEVVDPVGTAGGLALMWDDRISVEIDLMTNSFVNITCQQSVTGKKMRITFIHAPYTYPKRLKLWESLRQISSTNTLPWVCLGDFNEVHFFWEKSGEETS